jgi:CheY-like chemotaxis protein
MGGLGLMLTKATLNAIGGSIEIKSKLKEGTKVKIEYSLKTLTVLECLKNNIPYKATSEERFGALNLSLKGASRLPSVSDFSKSKCLTAEEIFAKLKGLKILVAEDHNVNKLLIKRILMRANIEVSICDNGELVVNKFLKSEPGEFDLILMDIQMPVMDGYEATRKIRNSKHLQGKTIPILALSANIFLDDLEISKQAGMNDHLVKPIDANVLYEKIYQYIFLGNTEKMGVNCD